MTFDQRGQKVSTQYNAGHDINLGAVQHSQDLAAELEKLKLEIAQAKNAGHIDEEKATDIEYQITKAAQEARKPHPNKKTLLDHLNTVKSTVEDITVMSGFVATIVGAIDAVRKLSMNYDMRKQQVHGDQYNAGKDIHITEIKAEDPLTKGRNSAEKGKKALARKEYATAQHLLEDANLLLPEKEASVELAQVKYCLALALLQGRMPFFTTLQNMRYIEELLRSAIRLYPLYSYYHTLSLFKLDFARHGLWDYKSDALKLKQKAQSKKKVQMDEENLRLLKMCQSDLLRRFQ